MRISGVDYTECGIRIVIGIFQHYFYQEINGC
jgi:hypothetical protein